MSIVRYIVHNKKTKQILEYDDFKNASTEYNHMKRQSQLDLEYDTKDIELYTKIVQGTSNND